MGHGPLVSLLLQTAVKPQVLTTDTRLELNSSIYCLASSYLPHSNLLNAVLKSALNIVYIIGLSMLLK